jgi:hypothetical protein
LRWRAPCVWFIRDSTTTAHHWLATIKRIQLGRQRKCDVTISALSTPRPAGRRSSAELVGRRRGTSGSAGIIFPAVRVSSTRRQHIVRHGCPALTRSIRHCDTAITPRLLHRQHVPVRHDVHRADAPARSVLASWTISLRGWNVDRDGSRRYGMVHISGDQTRHRATADKGRIMRTTNPADTFTRMLHRLCCLQPRSCASG